MSQQLIAGRYRLECKIGSGGMGVVWRATDTQLSRTVALKQARGPENADEARRMRREARHAASLEHEHVVVLYDLVFDEDGHPWLVMEYIPSPSLAELIESGRLEPRRTARLGAQIAEALAAAHRIGLMHRDVKPGNVLFRRIQGDGTRDHAKLTDFGIARRAADTTLTDGGTTGTAAYMSPEVCTLPQGAALARVPGLDPTNLSPGFAHWSCTWDGDAQGHRVKILFDRDQRYGPQGRHPDQRRWWGGSHRPPDRSDKCRIKVVYRPYRDDQNEVVFVDVFGPLPHDQLCEPAKEIATTVAAALPPP